VDGGRDGPVLAEALEASGGLDIRALLAEALHMGDEGHNRNKAGSIMYTVKLAPFLARLPQPERRRRSTQVLGRQRAERAQPGDGCLQGDGRWRPTGSRAAHRQHDGPQRHRFRHPGERAGRPVVHGAGGRAQGALFPGFKAEDASGDIGDSVITETAGIGGFAMASAPAIVTFVSGTPQDAINATLEMYEITYTNTSTLPSAARLSRTPTGVDIRKVVEKE